MRSSLIRVPIALLFLTAALFVTGLTQSAGCPRDGSTASVDFSLSEQQQRSLNQAASRYIALRDLQGAAAARAALVDELNAGFPHIKQAELGADGYSIRVVLEDGTVAAINTNSISFAPALTQTALARSVAAWPSGGQTPRSKPAQVRQGSPATAVCTVTGRPVRPVRILNPANTSNHGAAQADVAAVKAKLHALGWEDADIDLIEPAAADDLSTVPHHFLDLADVGIVVFVAHGGVWRASDGQDHFFLQCCSMGSRSGSVSDAEREQYAEWQLDGRLAAATTISESGEPITEFWMRDDLFNEFLRLKPNALVCMMASNSWRLADAFAAQSVGSYFGWDGTTVAEMSGTAAFLLGAMAEPPQTDEQARQAALAQYSGMAGGATGASAAVLLKLYTDSKKSLLTAWGSVATDPNSVPRDAGRVDVHIRPTDCPSSPIEFTMSPTETYLLDDLSPGEAAVEAEVRDAAGGLLGTGLTKPTIVGGGHNPLEVKICTGNLKLKIGAYPPDTGEVLLELHYNNSSLKAPIADAIAPTQTVELTDIPSAAAEVQAFAYGAADSGYSVTPVDIACGDNEQTICFGWLKLALGKLPFNTSIVTFTTNSAHVPSEITLSPGETRLVTGLDLHQDVIFTATAVDSQGGIVATKQISATIGCGENLLTANLDNYGIILAADPQRIPADGVSTSTITATLRAWAGGDVLTPTGDPVAGKPVHFGTSIGAFGGDDTITTDSAGQARINFSCALEGEAYINASVADDAKQAQVVVNVGDHSIALDPVESNINSAQQVTLHATVTPAFAPGSTVVYHWSCDQRQGYIVGPGSAGEAFETSSNEVVYYARSDGEGEDQVRVSAWLVTAAGARPICSTAATVHVSAVVQDGLPVRPHFLNVCAEPYQQSCVYQAYIGIIFKSVPGHTRYFIELFNYRDPLYIDGYKSWTAGPYGSVGNDTYLDAAACESLWDSNVWNLQADELAMPQMVYHLDYTSGPGGPSDEIKQIFIQVESATTGYSGAAWGRVTAR